MCVFRSVHIDAAVDVAVVHKTGSVKMPVVFVAVDSAFSAGVEDGAVAGVVGVENSKPSTMAVTPGTVGSGLKWQACLLRYCHLGGLGFRMWDMDKGYKSFTSRVCRFRLHHWVFCIPFPVFSSPFSVFCFDISPEALKPCSVEMCGWVLKSRASLRLVLDRGTASLPNPPYLCIYGSSRRASVMGLSSHPTVGVQHQSLSSLHD